MDLSKSIKQYYFDNFEDLPPGKQFHFASRLAAWEADAKALEILNGLQYYIQPVENVKQVLKMVMLKPHKRIYAHNIRIKYFEKYPSLYGLHEALFRVRHLKEIYGVDARQELLSLHSRDELENLYQDLINDGEAISILSRFAIDFIYLYELLFNKAKRFDPHKTFELFKYYDLSDPIQINLAIYLYTHSIIADTMFYVSPVPHERKQIYQEMLRRLEHLIRSNSNLIKLDTKFEFLVTCQIVNYSSRLLEGINKEARSSLNSNGNFIIDKLNGDALSPLNSFTGSEHRNVLFIMSRSAYEPRSTLL